MCRYCTQRLLIVFIGSFLYITKSNNQIQLFTELIRTSKSNNIIITGDLNAKSQEWNNNSTKECGKILEVFFYITVNMFV